MKNLVFCGGKEDFIVLFFIYINSVVFIWRTLGEELRESSLH